MTLPASQFLKLLPAVYQRATQQGSDPEFLRRYLLVFEALLGRASGAVSEYGSDDAPQKGRPPARKGLAELIDVLPDLFSPQLAFLFPGDESFLPPIEDNNPNVSAQQRDAETSAILATLNAYIGAAEAGADGWEAEVEAWLNDFLTWQSGWVGLRPKASWSLDEKREELAGAVQLFRKRGTAAGLQQSIEARTGCVVRVTNEGPAPDLDLGLSSILQDEYTGNDAVVGGVRPFAFLVQVMVSTYDFRDPKVQDTVEVVRAIVERDKPAHTTYVLRPTPYEFTLGESSTLGVSTLLPKPV